MFEHLALHHLSSCKGVFLDLYDTLIAEDRDTRFYRDLCRVLNVEFDAFMIHYRALGAATMRGALDGMHGRVNAALTRLLGDRFTRWGAAETFSIVSQLMPLYYEAIKVFPDTVATLQQLRRQGLKIFIVSNASSYSASIPERLGFADYVDGKVFSFEVGHLKPERQIYEYACAQARLRPPSILFVGDGNQDELRGARALGFRTVLIDRHLPHSQRAREDADVVVNSLNEILSITAAIPSSFLCW